MIKRECAAKEANMNQIQIQDQLISTMVATAGKPAFPAKLSEGIHAGRVQLAKIGFDENQAITAMYDAVDIGYLNIEAEKGLAPKDCFPDEE
jgi:hypothetical protein